GSLSGPEVPSFAWNTMSPRSTIRTARLSSRSSITSSAARPRSTASSLSNDATSKTGSRSRSSTVYCGRSVTRPRYSAGLPPNGPAEGGEPGQHGGPRDDPAGDHHDERNGEHDEPDPRVVVAARVHVVEVAHRARREHEP